MLVFPPTEQPHLDWLIGLLFFPILVFQTHPVLAPFLPAFGGLVNVSSGSKQARVPRGASIARILGLWMLDVASGPVDHRPTPVRRDPIVLQTNQFISDALHAVGFVLFFYCLFSCGFVFYSHGD